MEAAVSGVVVSAPMRRLSPAEAAKMTAEERLEWEAAWRASVVEPAAAADLERLAELDRMLELKWPTYADVAAENLNDVRVRELANEAEEWFQNAKAGFADYGPWRSRPPIWVTLPAATLGREHTEMLRLGRDVDPVVRAGAYRAFARRWRALAELPESDRRLLAARAELASRLADQRRVVESQQASAAAMGLTGFNATRWLAGFAGRGGHVALTPDGKLRAGPEGILSADDRKVLTDHRAELVAALGSDVEF